MSQFFTKSIAVLTALIVSLTVVAPDFIWEAKASDGYCVPGMTAQPFTDAHEVGLHADTHHDNHPCGGHMFSHLPIQASASNTPLFPLLPEAFGFQVKSIHLSPAPDSIDQPPKSSLA